MSTELALKLHGLGRHRILVVGDDIRDYDLHGEMTRFAQEDTTCPVFKVSRSDYRYGGAGAVREMVAGLGADCTSITGNGASIKARYFVDGRMVFRADRDECGQVTAEEEANLIAQVKRAVQDADCVLIADYGKGVCTERVLRATIDLARSRGIPCIVDPARGVDWARYAGATAIKCNSSEWAMCKTTNPLEHVAVVIVTDGPNGMTIITRESK